jgi:hypothetical protein
VSSKKPSQSSEKGKRKFLILVEGRNFLLNIVGERGHKELQRLGFFTHVHLEAPNETDAAKQAIAILRRDQELTNRVRNPADNRPTLSVTEIHELKSFDGCRQPRSSFILFQDPSSDSTREKVNLPKVNMRK